MRKLVGSGHGSKKPKIWFCAPKRIFCLPREMRVVCTSVVTCTSVVSCTSAVISTSVTCQLGFSCKMQVKNPPQDASQKSVFALQNGFFDSPARCESSAVLLCHLPLCCQVQDAGCSQSLGEAMVFVFSCCSMVV